LFTSEDAQQNASNVCFHGTPKHVEICSFGVCAAEANYESCQLITLEYMESSHWNIYTILRSLIKKVKYSAKC
jgi:hypothetical protein